MASLSLYCCGGAATNIGKTFHHPGKGTPGFASITTCFVDTSSSNKPPTDKGSFYHISGFKEDIDGSGKDRSVNFQAVTAAIPDILHQHPPGDYNIVFHSASGGSGSVAGPAIAAELLSRDKMVVVVQIGSMTCEQELRNTRNTILSYANICKNQGKSLSSIYLENNDKTSMSDVDALAKVNILLLAALFSGENHGLDTRDLKHFLDHSKMTKYESGLVELRCHTGNNPIPLEKGQAISSAVTLIRPGENPDPGMMLSYHSFGQISPEASEAINMPTPIHYHSIHGSFPGILEKLTTRIENAEELYRVNPVRGIDLSKVQATSSGIVL